MGRLESGRQAGSLLLLYCQQLSIGRVTTLCLKNDTGVAHDNFDADQQLLIIFGRDVAERVCYQTMICHPTFSNKCLCAASENMNP